MDTKDKTSIIVANTDIQYVMNGGGIVWEPEEPIYLARDSDFVKADSFGTKYWSYVGTHNRIIMPNSIKGEQITDFYDMFERNQNLVDVKIINNNKNITDLRGMFINCSNMVTLDLSEFIITKAQYLLLAFKGCSKLVTLDLSGINISSGKFYETFEGCNQLQTIYVKTQSDKSRLISERDSAKLNSSVQIIVKE